MWRPMLNFTGRRGGSTMVFLTALRIDWPCPQMHGRRRRVPQPTPTVNKKEQRIWAPVAP